MRRSADKAEDYARRHQVPRWYSDGQALIDDPEVDAVYIATPPDTHLSYTLMAAAAGKPVLVEKPMARTYAECQQMIAACRRAHVPLWVAYYRRRLPRFLKIKELVEAGAIGDVRSVIIDYRRPPLSYRRRSALAGASRNCPAAACSPILASTCSIFWITCSAQLN